MILEKFKSSEGVSIAGHVVVELAKEPTSGEDLCASFTVCNCVDIFSVGGSVDREGLKLGEVECDFAN